MPVDNAVDEALMLEGHDSGGRAKKSGSSGAHGERKKSGLH
jgi:hypothetical protein